jgi:two-component system, OmpR family, phosphate regulon response regulator PhoB
MQNPNVLIVEDERDIADMIALNLRHNGFTPTIATDVAQAIAAVNDKLPNAILLDWMLPGQGAVGSGLALAKKWRSEAHSKDVPILMLTAKAEEHNKVAGLEAGADDYIVKPFSTQELVARVRAVLRRRQPTALQEQFQVGALRLDLATHRVSFSEQDLRLGPTEFKLLHQLMSRPERVHSRTQLQDKVWGNQVFIEARTVDVHIKRLREALGTAASMVETVRGAGYRITATATASSDA